jgi:hypothetical protein
MVSRIGGFRRQNRAAQAGLLEVVLSLHNTGCFQGSVDGGTTVVRTKREFCS